MQDLNKKAWALITGASGGIGKALVTEFLSQGYSIIATDIVKPSTCIEDVHFLQLDLNKFATDDNYASTFYVEVNQRTEGQGIDCLINNAAIQILADAKSLTRKQWSTSFNINLHAPFFLSQLFADDLIKNKGSIVNVSSIHATQTKKEFVAYATTKAALSAMTRNLVLDFGQSIRINAIEPAAIATDMLKAGFAGEKQAYDKLKEFHPMGRIGDPEEIAKLASFLCSEQAGFIQGACISASGGIKNCLSDPV